tara:strand:- start:5203 stop:5340 length:138 start_codon:yes stop_codon:yes gene_type:complete
MCCKIHKTLFWERQIMTKMETLRDFEMHLMFGDVKKKKKKKRSQK